MKVFIFGGTGLIGSALTPLLTDAGYDVTVFTRNLLRIKKKALPRVTYIQWDSESSDQLASNFTGDYSIINLAGENLGQLWTKTSKQRMIDSRIRVTEAISKAIQQSPNSPSCVLQGSAVGYYGSAGNEKITENTGPGKGFLSELAAGWEKALEVDDKNVRIVFIRTGIVFSNMGGFLPNMLLPFRFFAGSWFGDGSQYLPWIHIHDQTHAMLHLLGNPRSSGPYNLAAPEPVTMKQFCKIAGKLMKRPCWMTIPAWILKKTVPEMADEVFLISQKVIPEKLKAEGFEFKFRDPERALSNLILT